MTVDRSAQQIGIFAEENQAAATPVSEEREIPPTPLEGQRWVDLGRRDEFIYNGQGYFESQTCSRLIKLQADGQHYCDTLKKVLDPPLTLINVTPEDRWTSVLEIAERLGPDYVQFCEDKLAQVQSDFSPDNKLTWLAVREVEEELQSYQRKKQKPKKQKSQKQEQKELEERTAKEREAAMAGPEETVDEIIQELAQRANRWIKTQGTKSPLSPVEADALFKKRLTGTKVSEILALAGELGFTDSDGQGEETKLYPEATDSKTEVSSEDDAEVLEFEVDAPTEGVESEQGVATDVEIPMLLDGSANTEAKEASCSEDLGLTAVSNSKNNDPSEPVVSSEAATEEEAPVKTEANRTLVELDNGDFADVETGEVIIRANVIRLAASAEMGELLPEQKKFEICDEESAAIFIGMIRRRQNNIVDALQFAASVINKNLSELNGLQGRFNYELKTTCASLMKKKKDGSFDGKTFNTYKGKVFFKTFGGLDIYDKKEFQAFIASRTEAECMDLGVEIVETWSKTVVELPPDNDAAVIEVIKELCPEAVIHPSEKTTTREPNLELIQAFVQDGQSIPGCRWIEPDELGEVTFGESTARSGFALSEVAIGKLFRGERKDVQTKFIGLTDTRYATPYKVTEVKQEESED